MAITLAWLGHATVVLDIDGVRLVTDPLLRRHNGILRRRGPRPEREAWRDPDAVLLSHLHHDHAEVSSLRRLGTVPVLTAEENAAWVAGKGLIGQGLAEGEWTPVGGAGVTVRLVPAVHHSRPMPHRPNAANGHLVRGPSGVVWLAGDTAGHAGVADLGALAGAPIDLAVVPIGGWGPRLSAGHMDPAQAAAACRASGARAAVPVHWKTLHLPGGAWLPRGWMDTPGPLFEEALAREAPSCRAVVLDVGGKVTLPATDR